MKKVPDVHNFWKWWSVQLGVLSGALAAAATAYGTVALIDRDLVSGLPQWFGVTITLGITLTAFLGVYARRLSQPKLENSDAGEISKGKESPNEPGPV